MANAAPAPDRIVETALAIADETAWGELRLHHVAARLGVSLAQIHRHFRDKDTIADAWLGVADAAMLAPRRRGFRHRPAAERLHAVIGVWFDALAPYRRVSGEMLAEKFYPGHPHHTLALVGRLSRTVQWIRDAAYLDAGGRRKQVEEIGISALFVASLVFWINDSSENQGRTRDFLARRLAGADRVMARLWPPRGD